MPISKRLEDLRSPDLSNEDMPEAPSPHRSPSVEPGQLKMEIPSSPANQNQRSKQKVSVGPQVQLNPPQVALLAKMQQLNQLAASALTWGGFDS